MTITLIPTHIDQAFRTTLVHVAPALIRPKLREAFANGPSMGGADHARRYFGDEFQAVLSRAIPLVDWLDRELAARRNLFHFGDWLNATGFGNDYRMIKALDAWAQLGVSAPPKETVH